MIIEIMLPYKTVIERTVTKITALTEDGVYQILPKHIDVSLILVPGVLVVCIDPEAKKELYFAVGDGFLIKKGSRVYISSLQVIQGESLETLASTVKKDLQVFDEKEQRAKQALTRLESDTVKRFVDLSK